VKRILDQHSELLKEWRRRPADLEFGKIRRATKGPRDTQWHDDTDEMIAALKHDIAIVEAIDEQYRG